MACNCEGKTINIGMGCCEPVLAPIENYYTKYQVDKMIEGASGCCITPEEVESAITSAITYVEGEIPTVPTSNTAFTNDAGYLTEHQSLSGYATEQWVEDQHYITGVDLSNYATKAEIPVVPTSNTAFTNDAGYLTEHQSLTAYSTTNEVNAMIDQSVSGKQDTLSAGTGIDITNNVISATGGGGGSTSIGFNYYSSINRFDLDYTTNGRYVKEVAFSVGDGLEVDDTDSANPIIKVDSTSAVTSGSTSLLTSGGAYAALQNVPVIWCGTQQQYDAISPKDPNTLYLIHN